MQAILDTHHFLGFNPELISLYFIKGIIWIYFNSKRNWKIQGNSWFRKY